MLNEYDYEEAVTSSVDRQFWEYFDSATAPALASTSAAEEPPRDQVAVLVTYSILLVVGGVGNVGVLLALTRTRRRRSRVDLLMTHLALADVAVTCGVIPLEIGWKYTNEWLAGNVLCKLLQAMRAFGLYLSSNVLVCISLDRFFAVIYPLRLPVARRRSKQMLVCAWTAALACSLPQSVVFRVMPHPRLVGFQQCVAFDAFSSTDLEVAYNVFCMCAMYFVPLVVITVCYVCIACQIRRTSQELNEKCRHEGSVRLRRSGPRVLERARRRTLRMTVTIVSVFAVCWLPYVTMAMWYMVDRKSASHVSPSLQDLLFAMAVSNSCMNPLVYGSYSVYTLPLRNSVKRLFRNVCCRSTASSDTIGNSSSSQRRNANAETPLFTTKQNGRRGVRFAETSFSTSKPDRGDRLEPPRPRGHPPPRLLCSQRERCRVLHEFHREKVAPVNM